MYIYMYVKKEPRYIFLIKKQNVRNGETKNCSIRVSQVTGQIAKRSVKQHLEKNP